VLIVISAIARYPIEIPENVAQAMLLEIDKHLVAYGFTEVSLKWSTDAAIIN
jgi:hypothetical protein